VEAEGHYPWTNPLPVEVYSTGVSPPVVAKMEPIPKEELVAMARGEANEFLKAGDALVDGGDYAGARAKYEEALTVLEEEDFPLVYGAIANTYMGEGNMEGAEQMADKALAIDEDFVGALKIKCSLAAAAGNLDEAEALLGKIPDDEVMHPNTLINMGLANFNKGEMDKAKLYLDRTIRDYPDLGQPYYFRGLTYLNLADNEAAKADFERFIELEPDSPQAAEATEYISYLSSEGTSQ
jgi:tetratricopeptide (TPR) repeat protein